MHNSESFTCNPVERRIRWEYEPKVGSTPDDPTGIEINVFTQKTLIIGLEPTNIIGNLE